MDRPEQIVHPGQTALEILLKGCKTVHLPSGVMSSKISLPNHIFTGQA